MRICLLTTSTTAHRMGGTEVHAETAAAEAARQGHQVYIVTAAHPDGLKTERKNGYEVIYLEGTSYTMSRREAPAWWKESAAKTAEICSSRNIDVVWAENFSGISYAAIPPSLRRPVISIVQGMAVRGEIRSSFNGISTPGGLLYFLTRYAAQTIFYYIPRFRAMVKYSDLLIGISNETAEALAAEFPGSRAKTRVIFNPVDTGLFRPEPASRNGSRAELGLAATDTAVIMSGVLHRQKGMHLGLAAFAIAAQEFPNARLLVAGEGPERNSLEKLAQELGLADRATFCGMKPNAEMPGLYNAADIYINPTLRGEGLGIVNLEAMACGLPCVISKAGGTASTIDEGISGYFTRPGDIGGIAEKLSRLLADAALRRKLGSAGREKAEKVFDKSVAVGRYIEVSEELLSGARR